MSTVKRISVSLPEQLEKTIIEMRRTEEYCRCSYAEIIRMLMEIGIKSIQDDKKVG